MADISLDCYLMMFVQVGAAINHSAVCCCQFADMNGHRAGLRPDPRSTMMFNMSTLLEDLSRAFMGPLSSE